MRHVLGRASSTSALPFLKPTSLYKPSILISKSLSTLCSTSTNPIRVSPRLSETFGKSESKIKQVEPLPLTKVTDTAALGQKRRKLPPTSPRKASASVRKSSRSWTIVNPAFSFEYYLGRNLITDSKMLSYIEFVTTPTSDTPGTAIVLYFDDKRYIIGNIHEGLQRACLQTGAARVFRAKDVFLTGRTECTSNGGLLGLILTLADAGSKAATARAKVENRKRKSIVYPGKEKDLGTPSNTAKIQSAFEDSIVRLHGGPNLLHTLATARSFIFRKGTPIKVIEHIGENKELGKEGGDREPTWSDNRVQVWAMPIEPSGVLEVNEDPAPESRKRSLGEFMTGARPSHAEILDQWSVHSATPDDQDEQNHRIREFAVSQMFSSAWSQDNLIEMPLRMVNLPATLFIRDPVTKELAEYEGPVLDGTAPVPDINVLVREAWPGALVGHLPPTKRSSTAMSFIIRGHKMRGKFNTNAAREKNVPSGPLWAALASGSSVQSSDGITVTPDMVLGPGKEGSGVAVIDLPSSEYVHNLVQRPEWKAAKIMSGVVAIIWMLGPGVVQNKTLLKFIESQPGVQHIISSPECCPNYLSMASAASMAIRHNQIDPARHAIPVHDNAISKVSGEPPDSENILPEMLNFCRPAKRGLKIKLQPEIEVTEEAVVPFLNTALVLQETSQDVLKLSQDARKEISSPAVQAEARSQNLPSPDAEIICLGTGSATPSQHRNVLASLLRVPGSGSYLMDCGENTLGQLKRMYTAPQLAEVFQDLKLIWISHLHADHHVGLSSVVKAWYQEVHGKDEVKRRRPTLTEQMLDPAKPLADSKRLFIVGQEGIARWLEEYSSVEDFGYDQLVPLVSFPVNIAGVKSCNLEWNGTNVGFNAKDPKIISAVRKATGLSNLVSCAVSHCWGAMAVSLTFSTGFKFSYSGDCRPSQTFTEIGRNSTVLLHEATFDDELRTEALAKKHSTISEAVGVGVAMGARRVILTHFSQRYQNMPNMSALDTRSVKFEDTENADDPSAAMDQPVERSTSPVKTQAMMDNILDSPDDRPPQAQDEPQPQAHINAQGPSFPSPTNTLAQILASNIDPSPHPQLNDMKIGVAFDYMRIKVGDIMHLDKFTPAFIELYKETEGGGRNNEAAKEAFSDDENDVLLKEQVKKEKKTKEEQAERARKGQNKAAKKRELREKWEKEKQKKDEKRKTWDVAIAEEEMTEPAVEKMSAVQ